MVEILVGELPRLPRPMAARHYGACRGTLHVSGVGDGDRGANPVVTGRKSGVQASGGKGFTKHFRSAAVVTRC